MGAQIHVACETRRKDAGGEMLLLAESEKSLIGPTEDDDLASGYFMATSDANYVKAGEEMMS